MEDSSTTDETLRLYRELREAGHDNVGIVLQARLKRTIDDVRALAELRPNVRLCKGIYLEPPEIAFRDFDAVQASFVQTLEELLEGGSYVGIATHDEWLLEQGKRLVARARPRARRLRVPDAARRAAGPRRRARARGPPAADLHAVRARTGTRTRCGGCRRTRRSPATSRRTRSTGCCRAATAPRA